MQATAVRGKSSPVLGIESFAEECVAEEVVEFPVLFPEEAELFAVGLLFLSVSVFPAELPEELLSEKLSLLFDAVGLSAGFFEESS